MKTIYFHERNGLELLPPGEMRAAHTLLEEGSVFRKLILKP